MTSVLSWQNSISLCPTSFCTPRPNLPVTTGVSWLPTFTFQSPIMKRTSFLGVSSRRSCRSSYNCSTSASAALLVSALTWITVLLNTFLGYHDTFLFRVTLYFRSLSWSSPEQPFLNPVSRYQLSNSQILYSVSYPESWQDYCL